MRVFHLISMVVLLSIYFASPVQAAEKKDKSAKRAAMMMQKLKQDFEAEKANLQTQFETEKKGLLEQLELAKSQQQELQGKLNTQLRKTKVLTEELNTVTSEKTKLEKIQADTAQKLDTSEKKVADLSTQLSASKQDLKLNELQRNTLAKQVASKHQSWTMCTEKNEKLYQFGKELIHIYDSPSTYSKAIREESFFQIKRVELENILQEKQDQLNAMHIVIDN